MVKSIWNRLKDNYFLLVTGFFFVIALMFAIKVMFFIMVYGAVNIEGRIISIEMDLISNPLGSGEYTIYEYKINANKKTVSSKSVEEYKVDDEVVLVKKGEKAFKIIKVNNIKVANRFGMEELFSVIIIVLFIIMLVLKIKK